MHAPRRIPFLLMGRLSGGVMIFRLDAVRGGQSQKILDRDLGENLEIWSTVKENDESEPTGEPIRSSS